MERDLSVLSGRHFHSAGKRVAVALSADLPKRRTFLTTTVDGVAVLVTRDRHGLVHAFRNECLHRDRPVIEGCGRSSDLTCSRHGWKYDLEGRLLGRSAGTGDRRLPLLAASEHDGRIWVSFCA